MQSGFDINHLAREAQVRWLKPVEVLFILQNYEKQQLANQVPQKPPGGTFYLFNKRVLKFFRKDDHSWRRRKDQRTTAEAHERLKVGSVEALNCYYAHGAENPNFQRRSYWMLDPEYEHIVFVHYRDVHEGRQCTGPASFSALTSSPKSFATRPPDSSFAMTQSFDLYQSSPRSTEIDSSLVIKNHEISPLGLKETMDEDSSPSSVEINQALRRIEQQLSLNDDQKEQKEFHFVNEDSNDLEYVLCDHHGLSGKTSSGPSDILSLESVDGLWQQHELAGVEDDIWTEILASSNKVPNAESGSLFGGLDDSLDFEGIDSFKYDAYQPVLQDLWTTPDLDAPPFDPHTLGCSLENNTSLTIAQKQKFTIREMSPDWCFSSDGAKILIIGSFLTDPLECTWTCMIGECEVPVTIVQEGVLCCLAPPHMPGKVNICITSGNRESCSEVREFEYRHKPNSCMDNNPPETKTGALKSSEEQLLLVRYVQMLLSDPMTKGDIPEFRPDLLSKSRQSEDLCNQLADVIRVGTSTSSCTLDWLLQELLKDNLEVWLSSKSQETNSKGCLLSKKELGILHVVAALGFEWALQPILSSGISIDFRDTEGWTALHWAARFGREKMVAALIASGASAGAVTDPNSQDPTGRTAASIAEAFGHRGLAGYLSEVALISHLSSLTLMESELSKGYADVEAERKFSTIQESSSSSTNEDQGSLKHTLAAVRNATQAAARIQSAFRAHSFRKRRQREAAASASDANGDVYSMNDIQKLSASLKLASHDAHDYNLSALKIQKKYRGWKGRKAFLALRQKVVTIQAHVRGYQVRKNYKVCWATSILEKVILRWRRHGVGLRGFKLDPECIDESEDGDILRLFRKQKVDAAVEEAVSRVLSMVESPEARQQYNRILEEYCEAKARLEGLKASASSSDISSCQASFISSHLKQM